MISAAIIGGAGYVGGELIRLLLHHPNVRLHSVQSSSQSGKGLHEVHHDLRGWTNLSFVANVSEAPQVLFLCGGHGQSKIYLANNPPTSSQVIIDLSADYRLKKDDHNFVYGLTELNKSDIVQSRQIANCGCFATAIQLGLLPAAASRNIYGDIHVTAITGSTGAGQQPSDTAHFSWRDSNISVYKPFTHQHLGEINQCIQQLFPDYKGIVRFVPMRGDFTRGIFASIYFESPWTEEEAIEAYKSYYEASPFVHISDRPISLKEVVNTNNTYIYLEKREGLVRIESIIDNLLKGAAGQAVQNMNLIFGLAEDAGLRLKASSF